MEKTAFHASGRPVADRRVFGARRAAWRALEDKTVIDALWADAGVAHAPSVVVPGDRNALVAAHRVIDRGAGTVWAADMREGLHGGASGTL